MTNDSVNQATAVPEVATMGVVLPDGAIIEQVANSRMLLRPPDGQFVIEPAIDYLGVRYVPVPLDGAFERALHLPDGPAEFGGLRLLTQDLTTAIDRVLGLSVDDSLLVAGFVLCTWMSEFLPKSAVLNLFGPVGSELGLRHLLQVLCRRPLTIVDCALRQLAQLPEGLSPTVFVPQPPELTVRRLIAVGSDRNVVFGDRIVQTTCSLVVFSSTPLSLPALRLKLPGAGPPYHQQQGLCDLQPRLLDYRLRRSPKVAASRFDAPQFAWETRGIARTLGPCFEGDAILQREVIAALEKHDEGTKARSAQSPEAVVLETLLALIHEKQREAYIGELTELANAFLIARQQALQLGTYAIGKMLRDDFGLPTTRGRKGIFVPLNPATAAAIHREAFARGVLSLLDPRADCQFCRAIVSDHAQPQAASAPTAPNAPTTPDTSSTSGTPATETSKPEARN
jgi:hypothetical protein